MGAHIAPLGTTLPVPIVPGAGTGFSSLGVVSTAGANTINTADGLIFESPAPNQRFYLNLRVATTSQGTSLTAKGHTALGTTFRSGHVATHNTSEANRKAHYISVMATENNTRITFSDIDKTGGGQISFVGAFVPTVVLNQYESYVVAVELDALAVGEDPNDLNGTLIVATDSTGGSARRNIIINSGSYLAGNPTGSGGRDIGSDQILPVDYLGTDFVMVKGAGTVSGSPDEDDLERPTVVAHSDNTSIFIGASTTPLMTIDTGEHFQIPGNNFPAGGTIYVRTTQPAYLYQTSCSNGSQNGQGLNFIPAVFPNLETQEALLASVNDLGTANLDVIATIGATVLHNGVPLVGPTPIPGNSVFETYNIPGVTGNNTIDSLSPYFLSLSVASGNRGAAGFFTGFPNSYAIRDIEVVGKNSMTALPVLDNDVKGFFDFNVVSTGVGPLGPQNGTVSINPDNTITYTPFTDYLGPDSFQYTILDTSSGFTDTTIVSITVVEAPGLVVQDLNLWLRADRDVTSLGGDNTPATAWDDQSASSNDAISAGGPSDPIFLDNGSSNLNFNPLLRFDGTDDRFGLPNDTLAVLNESHTALIVSVQDGAGIGLPRVMLGGGAVGANTETNFRLDSLSVLESGWGGPNHTGTIPVVSNQVFLSTFGYDLVAGRELFLGGVTDGTDPATTLAAVNTDNFVGSRNDDSEHWQGDIAEIIFYKRFLPADERQLVESYLAIKYGLTLSNADNDATIEEGDYFDSQGNLLWDGDLAGADSGYHNNIAGLISDDAADFEQKISRSSEGDIVTVSLQNNFITSNTDASRTDSLATGSALVLG